jgi:DNA-binding HxlR family transcriptional regulator
MVSTKKLISFRNRALESRDAIELLSDKWRITIIHVLRHGPLRTNELQRAITEVSPKVLTQTLRAMERDGLIGRKAYAVVPPRVEYGLTGMGRSLLMPLRDLCHWAKAHVDERDAARKRFDSSVMAVKATRQPRTWKGREPPAVRRIERESD